jgi:5-methylcytosine-specific restriction endonuclease McrA
MVIWMSKEYMRKYRKRNPEKIREWSRNYYHNNIEKERKRKREQARRLRKANPAKFRERGRRFYHNHREEILKKMAERERKLREKCLELFGFKCAQCGFSDKDLIEFDHVIPLRNRRERRGNYDEILKYSKDYQPLCPNCHKKKTLLENQDYMERMSNASSKNS